MLRDKLHSVLTAKEHLVISQFPSGAPVRRENFPQRNRTMAFISDCTIIVEAKEKSGPIHQGWEALRLGRPLYLLESLSASGFQWVDEFLITGARILSESDIDDMLAGLLKGHEGSFDELPL